MKNTRLYTLFEVSVDEKGRKHYIQASDFKCKLSSARRLFQGRLLSGALGGDKRYELRPVKSDK